MAIREELGGGVEVGGLDGRMSVWLRRVIMGARNGIGPLIDGAPARDLYSFIPTLVRARTRACRGRAHIPTALPSKPTSHR